MRGDSLHVAEYTEFDVAREPSRIDRFELKCIIILAGFSTLLAIPICLQLALGWVGPEYYWANSGNIFTDWSIYYLDFLPVWFIFSILWLAGKLTSFNLAKWLVFFYLGYWLFYDWAWQFIVIVNNPTEFSWSSPFYFAILIDDPPMWLFLVMAITGFLLSLLLLHVKDKPRNLLPFIAYLGLIYVPGAIGEVVEMASPIFYFITAFGIPLIALLAYVIWMYSRIEST